MTQEEKDLLLKDLCARLQYGVIVQVNDGIKGIYDRRLVQVFCDRLSCSVNVHNPLETAISLIKATADSVQSAESKRWNHWLNN